MCDGNDLAAEFISRDLVLGELLGAVPEDAPTVPLEADLRAQAKTLRLRIDPLERPVTLDLRKELDRGRSVLLHRLSALGVGWGTPSRDTVRATGTFRETWALRWRPELTVEIADAALWGTTVAAAAAGKITSVASTAADLATVTAAVESTLLADLPGTLPAVLRSLNEKAALDLDVGHLMTALPALVRAVRYGDVRGTSTGALSAVADALIIRICAGLPAAVSSLADDAAARLRDQVDEMHTAVALHARHEAGQPAREQWLGVLSRLTGRRDVHGLLAGRIVRLLLDAQVLAQDEAARRFAVHLSAGGPPRGQGRVGRGFPRPAAACCWPVTRSCLSCSMPGSRPWVSRNSWTCCRCCAVPSAGSPLRNGPTSAGRSRSSAAAHPMAPAELPSPSTRTAPRLCCVPWPRSWVVPGEPPAAPAGPPFPVDETERRRRWRLLLGSPAAPIMIPGPGLGLETGGAPGTGRGASAGPGASTGPGTSAGPGLSTADQAMDAALAALTTVTGSPARRPRAPPGSVHPRRLSPGGWATSAATSRAPWSR